MIPRSVPIFLVAVGLSCAQAPRPSAPDKGVAPSEPLRVALSAAPRTLSADASPDDDRLRERLAAALSRASGHNVIVIRRTGATDFSIAEVEAAEEDSAVILSVTHVTGTPNSFVAVTARSVETGEVLGETAVPRESAWRISEGIRAWYEQAAGTFSGTPPLSVVKLLRRFEKEGHCQAALALLSRRAISKAEDQKEADGVAERCRFQVEHGATLLGAPLSIRTENLSPKLGNAVSDTALNSRLLKELQVFYRTKGELTVLCEQECGRGRMRLSMPFREEWHRSQATESKNPLGPYLRAASALLEFRASLRRSIPAVLSFPTELVLAGPTNSLALEVTGGADRPSLKPKSDPQVFFHAGP